MNNLPRVLHIDEKASDRRLASLVLKGEFGNLDLESIGSAAEFSSALAAARFGLVITEASFSWISGIEVVQLVRDVRPDCPVVLFTAEVGEELWGETLRLGVDGYVRKSSEGFVRLPNVLRSVFFRNRRRSVASSRDAPYRRMIERLPLGVFVATADGEILEANPAFASMLGLFDPEEAAWASFPGFFADQVSADKWRNQMATARYSGRFDTQLKRVDGKLTWVRISSWEVEDGTSGMRHIQGLVEETGDFQNAQAELAARTDALGRSNDELEQFAYVVSHDLQQPLSLVSSYLELLSDSAEGKLSGDENSYLEHASSGAIRVQEMVDAVLGYARVDSQPGDFVIVDLEKVLEKIEKDLWKEKTCARAEITHTALPNLVADAGQMEQLLSNLVANAFKFAGGRPARVHVAAEDREDCWEISVSDQGIGIPPQSLERIFVMFQRLHTQKEYPGTGIGLTICKRIVERHGGEMRVESRPERGSTFFFTISKDLLESEKQTDGG